MMEKKRYLVVGFFFLVLVAGGGYFFWPRVSQEQSRGKMVLQGATVVLHNAGATAVSISAEVNSPNYQKIIERVGRIIGDSVLVPVERQSRLKLLVDPTAFPQEMAESDYLEIQLGELLAVETSRYDKIRFVLTGPYEKIIFLHAAPPSDYWGAWNPADLGEFWELREFLGLPPESLATTAPVLRQTTSPLSSPLAR